MPQLLADTHEVEFKLTLKTDLEGGDEDAKFRTLSLPTSKFDTSEERLEQLQNASLSLANFLLGAGSTLIQPSNWQDDGEEDPYYTTNVATTFVHTKKLLMPTKDDILPE